VHSDIQLSTLLYLCVPDADRAGVFARQRFTDGDSRLEFDAVVPADGFLILAVSRIWGVMNNFLADFLIIDLQPK
jgi:hypothetical protein